MLSIDLIFHPTSLTAAALTLRPAGLIDVIGHEATRPVRAGHILIIITVGVLGGSTEVLGHDVCLHAAVRRQFGNVAEGIGSLHRAT